MDKQKNLADYTDRELLVLLSDLSGLYKQISSQIDAVNVELDRRVKEEKNARKQGESTEES